MSARKYRVLLAARPNARFPFQEALADEAEFLTAETLADAQRLLESDHGIDMACSTLYFDESRMFDFLTWARTHHAALPVICARALPKDVAPFSLAAVAIAAESMGATAFVDYPQLLAKHGAQGAAAELKSIMKRHLSP